MEASQVLASGALLDPEALTIGFARRFATYKRATLIFRDVRRLKRILHAERRPVQIVFAGKAHPADGGGKEFIQQVYQFAQDPEFGGRIAFLEDYDLHMARFLVQGVDVWLNNPRRPNEASGTSGMKAAMNGVPNLSVLDGWWPEAYHPAARRTGPEWLGIWRGSVRRLGYPGRSGQPGPLPHSWRSRWCRSTTIATRPAYPTVGSR